MTGFPPRPRLLLAAALLPLLGGCASPAYLPETDPVLVRQVETRIAALEALRGADLYADIEALGSQMRLASVPSLLRAVATDPSPRVRAGCAQALGFAQDPRAVEPLAEASTKDGNPGVRYTAAYSLCLYRDPRGLVVLMEALVSGDPTHRRDAHVGLVALTGLDFGYDPMGDPEERKAGAARWEEWFRRVGPEEAALVMARRRP